MHIHELAQRLKAEGCNPAAYAIGFPGAASDAFCLTHNGRQWEVFYTERGQHAPPIYASGSESQACAFFLAHMLSLRHDHCVGFFQSPQRAAQLLNQLQALGLDAWADEILCAVPAVTRHRVFVTGKDIFPAEAALGTVPATDLPDGP